MAGSLLDVLTAMQRQLDWRGPKGQPQGHIVISRQEAALLVEKLKIVIASRRDEDA